MLVRLRFTGLAPLMMHNGRLADPLDPHTKALSAATTKAKGRTKTDEDIAHVAYVEWIGSLYHSEELGPFQPGVNLERCLADGAASHRMRPQFLQGVYVPELEVPLIYNGPRDIDGLWKAGNNRLTMGAKVGRARVMRTRPIFRDWSIEFDLEVDTAVLDLVWIPRIADSAGGRGLGEYRPRYGRFKAEVL
jgi:hypothetical protein